MLKSYEATYDNGQITWLSDRPQFKSARIIITVLEETPTSTKTRKRTTSTHLIDRGKTLSEFIG